MSLWVLKSTDGVRGTDLPMMKMIHRGKSKTTIERILNHKGAGSPELLLPELPGLLLPELLEFPLPELL